MTYRTAIYGLREARRAMQAVAKELDSPQGAIEQAVEAAAQEAQRYARIITHVQTGTLRGSHEVVYAGRNRRRIAPSGASINPLSGQPATAYAFYEHQRGGSHAFYERVPLEDMSRIGESAYRAFRTSMR